MTHYKLVVFSEPTDGQEAEYHRWYDEVHLPEVMRVSGFVSAQRFTLNIPMIGELPHKFMSIYEVDCDDPQRVLDDLVAMTQAGEMNISGALNLETPVGGMFEACSAVIMAPARAPA
jgi:hypothetical protein